MGEATITRELVRDPCELVVADGKRYATQRWVERCQDIRTVEVLDAGLRFAVDYGWTKIGEPFPTPDSVASPLYEPPRFWKLRKLLARVFG